VREKVEQVLNQIRPSLHADGGDVELVDVKDGIVSVKLTGACSGCPMSTLTLKNGIERLLKEEISGIEEVVGV
jgi:Fe-S cluster biogenesis protein NfuA